MLLSVKQGFSNPYELKQAIGHLLGLTEVRLALVV